MILVSLYRCQSCETQSVLDAASFHDLKNCRALTISIFAFTKKNLQLNYDKATTGSMFGLYLCSGSKVVVTDDSTGFPLSGKSGTVGNCFDWNVCVCVGGGEFCCLAGNFFAVKCCLHL